MRRSCALGGVIAAALLALPGCGPEPTTARWQLRVPSDDVRQRAAAVDAIIREGGCDGARVVYRAEVRTDAPGPPPPVLDPGRYGFAGRVRDAECRTIARGCVEATLPDDGDHFEVTLEPVSEAPACAASACRGGRCAGEVAPDAGGGEPPSRDAGSPAADAATDAAPDAGALRCRPGTDSCYVLHLGPATWDDAQAACIAMGGHLLHVDDADEHAWLLATYGADLDVWIGLTDAGDEGEFEWTDGDEPDWTAWAPGQPDEHPPGEDCVALRGATWEDRLCRQDRGFLCERD